MAIYIHTAKVKGSGSFPMDMLRYDQCFPATEDDSYEMTRASSVREITVKAWSDRPFSAFTPARWHSFTWSLEHLETRKL